MKLLGPDDLARIREELTDKALRKKFDQTIGQLLDQQVVGQTDENRLRRLVFYVAGGLFTVATVVTITLVVLASLKVVQLDDKYISLLWKAFVGELIAIVVVLVRHYFPGRG